MIRHLAELAALVIIFGVGIGLLIAFGAGLLLIWRPEFKRSQTEEEYRRVEGEGSMTGVREADRLSPAAGRDLTCDDPLVGTARTLHPYDWAKREPMIWGRS